METDNLTIEVATLLQANRPSHRARLKEIFEAEDGPQKLQDGLTIFLKGWVDGDHLDGGNVYYSGVMFHRYRNREDLMDVFKGATAPQNLGDSEKAVKVATLFWDGIARGQFAEPQEPHPL